MLRGLVDTVEAQAPVSGNDDILNELRNGRLADNAELANRLANIEGALERALQVPAPPFPIPEPALPMPPAAPPTSVSGESTSIQGSDVSSRADLQSLRARWERANDERFAHPPNIEMPVPRQVSTALADQLAEALANAPQRQRYEPVAAPAPLVPFTVDNQGRSTLHRVRSLSPTFENLNLPRSASVPAPGPRQRPSWRRSRVETTPAPPTRPDDYRAFADATIERMGRMDGEREALDRRQADILEAQRRLDDTRERLIAEQAARQNQSAGGAAGAGVGAAESQEAIDALMRALAAHHARAQDLARLAQDLANDRRRYAEMNRPPAEPIVSRAFLLCTISQLTCFLSSRFIIVPSLLLLWVLLINLLRRPT